VIVSREASSLVSQSKDATASAVALADHGFCPVTKRPSTTTYDTNGMCLVTRGLVEA
jgi:hypothetical protein